MKARFLAIVMGASPLLLCDAVGDAAAEGFVATADVLCQQTHGDDLEEEELTGQVDETEEEHPEGTKIKGEQTVPEHQRQRRTVDILMYRLRHLIHTAELVAQDRQQALELGRDILLLLGIVDVRPLEPAHVAWRLSAHLVVDLLLADGVVELAALLALQEEEVHLDVVVGQTLLRGDTLETGHQADGEHDDTGNPHVSRRVGDAQPAELEAVVMVEAPHESHVDGCEPGEAGQTVEDTSHAALLARHTGQLAVGTVEDVGHHQQGDGGQIDEEAREALVIEAAVGKQHTAAGTDEHREDGHRVGVDIEIVETFRAIVAEGADDVEVKPVLGFRRFQCLIVFFIHFFDVFIRFIPRCTSRFLRR